jgi:hypothetical protein
MGQFPLWPSVSPESERYCSIQIEEIRVHSCAARGWAGCLTLPKPRTHGLRFCFDYAFKKLAEEPIVSTVYAPGSCAFLTRQPLKGRILFSIM